MEALRAEIKRLAEEQIVLKNQRKTVNLVGERTMETWKATMKHFENRIQLRLLYAALGLIRGLEMNQIETNPKVPISMSKVNKLVEKYAEVIHTD